MKTPEEMAEKAIKWVKTLPPASERCNQCACEGYRAGYKAAQEQYEARIKELEQAIIQSVDAMAGVKYDDENT